MKKICQICCKPSGMYPLCTEHLKEKNEGKIEKCPKCNKWHYINEKCDCIIYTELPTEGFNKCISCKKETNGYAFCKECYYKYSIEEMLQILNNESTKTQNEKEAKKEKEDINFGKIIDFDNINDKNQTTIKIDNQNKNRCITCGKTTDGTLFCPSCYYKYKDKELLVKISKCTNIDLMDDNYEGRYTCKDGHIVKSKSEREIDNYLFDHGIPHAYEKELAYGPNSKDTLKPDFFLPDYISKGESVYIEHWGYNENNINYTKTKKFKISKYKELKTTMICTYEKTDMGKINTVLERKLNKSFIKLHEINFEDESFNAE